MQKSNFCGSVLELQCTGPCFSLCIVYFYRIIYSFLLMFWNSKDKIPSTCSLRFFWIPAFSGLQRYTTKLYIYFFGCWRQTSLLKIPPKFWQTFQNICKHNASLLNWQHFEKQYDKTTQLVSTLVQNPYIFDHITYVPT